MENVLILLGILVLVFFLIRRGGVGCCGGGHSQTPSGDGKKDEKTKPRCH